MRRIGKVDFPVISPILGSRQTQAYRNKLEFGFSNKRWLTEQEIATGKAFDNMNAVGFHITGAFDKILDITECRLLADEYNKLRNGLSAYALARGLTIFDYRAQQGLLRNMMVRLSATGEIMLLMQFCIHTNEEYQQAQDVLEYLHCTFPEITSLL